MPSPSREERLEFWKHAYAWQSFIDAKNYSERLLALNLPLTDLVRKAFTIAILTTYCRPFKQRPLVRLSADLVPNEHKETHESAIELRDKVVAHRDMDGPNAEWGWINQLELEVLEGEVTVHTRSPFIRDQNLRDFLALLNELIPIMYTKMSVFSDQHFASLSDQQGIHVLLLDEECTNWTNKVE
jgi:hypothetical protein